MAKTYDEALLEFVAFLDLDDANMTKEYTAKVFSGIKDSEMFADYLRDTMATDVRRYFAAQTDENRAQIKGAFARTAYIAAKLRNPFGNEIDNLQNKK